MDGNPWQVDSLQDFLCLKCPECTFDTQEEDIFQEHAVGNHPLSYVFFRTVKMEGENLTIEECFDQNADNIGEIDPLDSTESTKYMIDCKIEFKDEFSNTEIDSKAKDTSEAEKIQNENDKHLMDKSDISDKKSVNMNSAYVHFCDLCDKSFMRKDRLKRHITKVHEGIRPYKCGFCNDSFKEKENWKAHEKSVHEGQDPKSCHLCDFKAKPKLGYKSVRTQGSYTSVKTHIAIVHEGRKLFSCSTCKKDLSSKQKLERHIKTVHEGLRPYLCSDCGSSFSTSTNLKQHVASIHEKTKQHKCTICGASFSLSNYLKRHVKKAHEENNPGDLTM